MDTCIFCDIIAGKIPSFKIYEDEVCYAFLDINPFGIGHTLVIPKVHATNLLTVPTEVLVKLIPSVQKVAKLLKEKLQCSGIAMVQLNGESAGQTVFHIHFHLIPRYSEGEAQVWAPITPAPTMEALAQLQAKILA